LDRKISIEIDLIANINELPTRGKYPTLLFADKNIERAQSKAMRVNFCMVRGVRSMNVTTVCNPTIRISTHMLACKHLLKCKKDQVPTWVIVVIEKCVEGTTMSWAPFLLNQFLLVSLPSSS
jgi:hypothetical protein